MRPILLSVLLLISVECFANGNLVPFSRESTKVVAALTDNFTHGAVPEGRNVIVRENGRVVKATKYDTADNVMVVFERISEERWLMLVMQ